MGIPVGILLNTRAEGVEKGKTSPDGGTPRWRDRDHNGHPQSPTADYVDKFNLRSRDDEGGFEGDWVHFSAEAITEKDVELAMANKINVMAWHAGELWVQGKEETLEQ